MSRPFDRRRPSDFDRRITSGMLLTLAVVVAAGIAVVVPEWRSHQALRAE